MKSALPPLLGACLLGFTSPLCAALTDTIWQGESEANFTANGNWSASAPTNTSRGVINGSLGGGSTVTFNANRTIGGLSIASGFTLTRATSDTTLRRITFDASTGGDSVLTNAGTISSGGSGGSLNLRFNHLGTYANSGTMEATAGSSLWLEDSGTTSDFLLDNTGGTIRTVGNGALYFPQSSARTWVIKGGSVLNPLGTIHFASTRGTLDFQGVNFNNGGTANMVQSVDGSLIYYLRFTDGASFTNTGLFEVVNDWSVNTSSRMPRVQIGGGVGEVSFTNSGTIRVLAKSPKVQSGNADTGFLFQGDTTVNNTGLFEFIAAANLSGTSYNQLNLGVYTVTLQGAGGRLRLEDQTSATSSHVRITGGADSHLINTGGHIISGGGAFGAGALAQVTNHATIHADAARVLEINLRNASSSFTNTGLLHASGAGGISFIKGTLTNSGEIRIGQGSALTLDTGALTSTGLLALEGTLTSPATLTMSGGELRGAGTVVGNLEVSAPVTITTERHALGDSLRIAGNLSFADAPSDRVITLGYGSSQASLEITGNLSVGQNHRFEFTLATDAGYEHNTVYSMMSIQGTQNLDLSTLSLSFASLDAGFALDQSFGTGGWNLNGNVLEMRLSDVPVIPEAQTWGLLLLGVGAMMLIRRRRTA